jgi:phosphoglycolate phosphatase
MTVGFDLDMTLIDSRPGIRAAYQALTAETGVYVDADLAVSRLGPPLRRELAEWFPPDRIEEVVTTYRKLSAQHAIEPTVPMAGAHAALDAVRALGLRVVIVTSKLGRLAHLHLDHLGLAADEVVGDVFAEAKGAALIEHGVQLYVGDHVGDMVAARFAGVPGVGVVTGPCTADELREAGATYTLPDLTGFPALLARLQLGPSPRLK